MKAHKVVKTARAMANLSDKWWALRARRLEMEKEVADVKKEENQAKAALIASLVSTGTTAIGGKNVRVSHIVKVKPIATDWSKVWQWAVDNDAPDLFQRRLGEKAVKERWEDDTNIPGIEEFLVDDISYSKS